MRISDWSSDVCSSDLPARLRLNGVMQRHAPLAAVAKQALEAGLVLRGGDDQNLANPRQHQDGKRIIDHRLVVDRHQLLRHRKRQRMKACSRSSGQYDATQHEISLLQPDRKSKRLNSST